MPNINSTRIWHFFVLLFLTLHGMIFRVNAASATEVDVEIVLAVDISGSVNPVEYDLQMKGYSDAFTDPVIQSAITSGPIGKIAVALMLWSDAAFTKYPTKWYLIDSPHKAQIFANDIINFRKHAGSYFGIGGGGTGIGEGVKFAIGMIESNQYFGTKKIIDVSGDGIETDPWFKEAMMIQDAKKLAVLSDISINGLPILKDFPNLDIWYRDNVISGVGSFVISADNFEAFGEAILRKLWREFSHNVALDKTIIQSNRRQIE